MKNIREPVWVNCQFLLTGGNIGSSCFAMVKDWTWWVGMRYGWELPVFYPRDMTKKKKNTPIKTYNFINGQVCFNYYFVRNRIKKNKKKRITAVGSSLVDWKLKVCLFSSGEFRAPFWNPFTWNKLRLLVFFFYSGHIDKKKHFFGSSINHTTAVHMASYTALRITTKEEI